MTVAHNDYLLMEKIHREEDNSFPFHVSLNMVK